MHGGDGSLLFARLVRAGDTVDLSYLHSVERTVVVERFEIVPGGLRLVMTSFGSTGAGLPASHPDLVIQDGRFVITGFDMVLREVPLLTSEATRNLLELKHETYPLRGRVTVLVRQRPAWVTAIRRTPAAGL